VGVHHDEGVAIHVDPESCAAARDQRSVDRGAHRPAIEPRKYPHPGGRRRSVDGRQDVWARYRKCPDDPAWSQTLACADAPCAGTVRSHDWPAAEY
jgi:hypothetical protein